MRQSAGVRVLEIREQRMWTQIRLAKEAGVSPTTVSGIESGKISRPHFGTLEKLAVALNVEAAELLSGGSAEREEATLRWAMSAEEEEFEERLESVPVDRLRRLILELEEEKSRLRDLYARTSSYQERRVVKSRIRHAAANCDSLKATLAHRYGE